MTGSQYEQVVRAILARKLAISPAELRSGREPGATLPGGPPVQHQVDLVYSEAGEVADYITVIECKYRSSAPVDQEEVAKLAFVKGSMRASKAILVTNTEFTRGAQAVAEAEKIALLIIRPDFDERAFSELTSSADADELFRAVEAVLDRSEARCNVLVVKRFAAEPGGGRDLIDSLAADPEVRAMAEAALRDPRIRSEVERVVRDNPDLARKAIDFFKRGRF